MRCSVKNVPRGIKVTVAGCTQVGGYKGACIIFVAKSSVLKKHGYTVEDIVRHETGHCNGWKHPEDFGARMKEEEGLRAFHLKHKKVQGPALYSKPTAMVPPADFLPPLRF
jgi:hypothetical protein